MRIKRAALFLLGIASFFFVSASCEDGPKSIFKPIPPTLNPDQLNGHTNQGFLPSGTQPFKPEGSKQEEGTTVICQADELAKRWATMVKAPIVPTVGAGGLDLRGKPTWAGLSIDDAQQQLCQAYVYGTQMVYWGDNAELLAFYDKKTRLMNRLVTLPGYEGTIKAGDYEIAVNKTILKNGKTLSLPASDANLRAMNIALLKAFRKEVKNPDARDCVALNTCYSLDWYQLKRLVFNDVMLDFALEPEGSKVAHIGINLNRSFEMNTSHVKFDATPAPSAGLPPVPNIPWKGACKPTLGTTWGHIVKNCLGIDPKEKALVRPIWGNEALYADMGGLSLYMQRPSVKADAVIPDNTKADPADVIVGMGFSSQYGGMLEISRVELYAAFAATVAAAALAEIPAASLVGKTLDLPAALADIRPKGKPDEIKRLNIGTQKVLYACDLSGGNCKESTLTIRAREAIRDALDKASIAIPEPLKDPNFYVKVLLREALKTFNEKKDPGASESYIYVNDDSAQVMSAVLLRQYNNDRYAVRLAYHNKSDQLLFVFFKRGSLHTEDVLFKDATLRQYDKKPGDGVFRLWNLARSPRMGLGKKLFPKKTYPAIRKAVLALDLGGSVPTDLMVDYHKQNTQSGFSIPVEGQRDKFYIAARYGFSGNVVGASLYAKDGIVRAVSSGAFYDKLDFCGQKVGLWDRVDTLLKTLPKDCKRIVSYSDNGKLLSAVSTYVSEKPFKIGLRLYVTAKRVSGAYYWAEE